MAEDIATFLSTTAQLAEWLDSAEKQIQQFNDLPIVPEELSKQSDDLVEFVNDVSNQAQLLGQFFYSHGKCSDFLGGVEISFSFGSLIHKCHF